MFSPLENKENFSDSSVSEKFVKSFVIIGCVLCIYYEYGVSLISYQAKTNTIDY